MIAVGFVKPSTAEQLVGGVPDAVQLAVAVLLLGVLALPQARPGQAEVRDRL